MIAGTSTPCYQIHFDSNGTKTVGYIPQSQIAIAANGQLRVGELVAPHALVVYDATGRVVTPSNDFTLDIHAGISYNMETAYPGVADFARLNLVHTKPVTIRRSLSSFVRDDVLTNPAFVTELNNRMGIAHQEHIEDTDHADSQIYKTIRSHLDQHPDFARLSDTQKEELYHNIL